MSDNEDTNGSIAELESIKQKLSDTEKRFNDAEEKLNASQTLLANAIAALAGAAAGAGEGHVPAAPPSIEDIRREKVTKLYTLLQKSQKIKDYKESLDEPFRKWFDRYETELYSLGNINCNIDLVNHALRR